MSLCVFVCYSLPGLFGCASTWFALQCCLDFLGHLHGTAADSHARQREREERREKRERVSSIPLGHVATPKQNGKKDLSNSF